MIYQHKCDCIWWQAVYLWKCSRFALIIFRYLSRSPFIDHFQPWKRKYFLWKKWILSWNFEMKNVSYTAFIWADVQCPLYLQLWNYKMFIVLNCDARVWGRQLTSWSSGQVRSGQLLFSNRLVRSGQVRSVFGQVSWSVFANLFYEIQMKILHYFSDFGNLFTELQFFRKKQIV